MNANNIILEILNKRDVRGDENIEEFLSPLPKRTYDPFLLLNMKEGVDLILRKVKECKKICIYGDYDSDGITSISTLKLTLDTFCENVSYYIPSRFDDGYGLNKDAIKGLYKQGIDLIITVDCGIVSFEEVRFAKELGMDIIITDHHSIGEKIPECIVINPKQPNCSYPFKDLAGCGVTFKLCQALQRTVPLPKETLNSVLDIVAIGTIGDIVPLLDENRTMVKFGLGKMREQKRVGLDKLCEKLFGKNHRISSEDISYGIVPHLNAAGRMEHAKLGVELFMAQEEEEACKIVDELMKLNQMRKTVQEETYKKSLEIYERKYTKDKFPIVVVEDGHEGVTGIVAGKLKDYSQKPVAILTEDGENYKGTSRSLENINIYDILGENRDIFEKFGGHSGACGFSIKKENLNSLRENVKNCMEKIDMENMRLPANFDIDIEGEEISFDLIRELDMLEPFGHCNEKPIFKLSGYKIRDMAYMGKEKQHIRFGIKSDDETNFKCVYFNHKLDEDFFLEEDKIVNIYGKLNINTWKGRESIQFIVTNLDDNFQ